MTATRLRSLLIAALLVVAHAASPVAAAEVLDSGRWTARNYEIAGGWQIVSEGEERFVVLDEDFRTRKAPDLKLFLSPRPLADLADRNALREAVRIAPLEGHSGKARYAIPVGVDLSLFQSLILHCERYSKLWGGTAIAVD